MIPDHQKLVIKLLVDHHNFEQKVNDEWVWTDTPTQLDPPLQREDGPGCVDTSTKDSTFDGKERPSVITTSSRLPLQLIGLQLRHVQVILYCAYM